MKIHHIQRQWLRHPLNTSRIVGCRSAFISASPATQTHSRRQAVTDFVLADGSHVRLRKRRTFDCGLVESAFRSQHEVRIMPEESERA